MEVVMLSCKVSKFNKYNWQQERALVITQENIYNFRQKSMCLPHINTFCRGEARNPDREACGAHEEPALFLEGVRDPCYWRA